jgi:putative FmdB family regulatory protein
MPRYEHKCIKDICEFLFEVSYKITEEPAINCPKCASPTNRQISRNVTFETPMDVDFTEDPSELSKKGFAKVQRARKTKFRW